MKKKFNKIAKELVNLEIMSNLDSEALARYLVVEKQYQEVTEEILSKKIDSDGYFTLLTMQDKLFKMCRSGASDLGLTISSRCRLVVPKQEEKPKNKFSGYVK